MMALVIVVRVVEVESLICGHGSAGEEEMTVLKREDKKEIEVRYSLALVVVVNRLWQLWKGG